MIVKWFNDESSISKIAVSEFGINFGLKLNRVCKADEIEFFEFREGRKFIGFAMGFWDYEHPGYYWIDYIYVASKYHGKGYGRWMIEWFGKHFKKLRLSPASDTFKFYEHLEFKYADNDSSDMVKIFD